jgi:glutathione S-transferase
MGTALPKIKLSYFDIEGVAEPIRLALKVNGVDFEDDRVSFDTWRSSVKETTKFGQLPVMTLDDGEAIAQSGAMLRFAGRLKDSPLYPAGDIAKCLLIEEALGLAGDFDRSLQPSLYIGMAPKNYGFPEGYNKTPEGQERIKKLRQEFAAETLPRFMSYYDKLLGDNAYFAGNEMTIADCYILPQLRKFTRGIIDHIPNDILDKYPKITGWMARMYENPAIAKHYSMVPSPPATTEEKSDTE